MYSKTEKKLKALSDYNRLRIVNMLYVKPLCVCELTDIMSLSQSTVSGHLRILKDAEIVDNKKDGLWVEYSIYRGDNFTSKIVDIIIADISKEETFKSDIKKCLVSERFKVCKK